MRSSFAPVFFRCDRLEIHPEKAAHAPHHVQIANVALAPYLALHPCRAYYKYMSSLIEPWDGPALIAFTDGEVVSSVCAWSRFDSGDRVLECLQYGRQDRK